MKLISLSDFVRIAEYPTNHEEAQSELVLIENFYNKVTQYNRFLKQPLELWMFVPCDENGNVLDEKMIFASQDKDYVFEPLEFDKYQQAKERCLFENIEYVEAKKDGEYSFLRITGLGQINYPKFWKGLTVEDLVKYNLELTPTAQKQISC